MGFRVILHKMSELHSQNRYFVQLLTNFYKPRYCTAKKSAFVLPQKGMFTGKEYNSFSRWILTALTSCENCLCYSYVLNSSIKVEYKLLLQPLFLTFWFVLFPVVFLACRIAVEHSLTTRTPLQIFRLWMTKGAFILSLRSCRGSHCSSLVCSCHKRNKEDCTNCSQS